MYIYNLFVILSICKLLHRFLYIYRYINAGDAKCFDDQAMACLHPLADSLEFLDVSGTSVTERGLGYLRLFSNLRYLNLSRLKVRKKGDFWIFFYSFDWKENSLLIVWPLSNTWLWPVGIQRFNRVGITRVSIGKELECLTTVVRADPRMQVRVKVVIFWVLKK